MPSVVKPNPHDVIKMLQEGNHRFYTGKSTHPHASAARLKLAGEEAQSQYAYATILTCSDSRVPVELIFDAGVMDLFVVRVAGDVCNTDEVGSIEFGLAHVHTPVLVVLGHTRCGAVTTAAQILEGSGLQRLEWNIPSLIDNIIPAVKRALKEHAELRGDAIVPYAIEENVWQSIHDLFLKSAAVRNHVKEGKVKVVGAVYDIGRGHVNWLPSSRVNEILGQVEASPDKAKEPFAAQ